MGVSSFCYTFGITRAQHLVRLDELWDWLLELSAKDNIPKSVCNSKAVLIIHEVVLHMPFLGFLVESRQLGVVEKVVGEIIDDIASDSTAECGGSHRPVPEDGVSEFPERRS